MGLNKDFFSNNRKRLIAKLPKNCLIIIAGNARMQRNADNPFPFRQDSNFYYLTGIAEPCATLVIDTKNHTQWVMLPLRQGIHAIFDGAIDTADLVRNSGIDEIITEADGWQRLKKLKNMQVYMPEAPKAKLADMYTNPFRSEVVKKVHKTFSAIYDIRPVLADLRSIKTKEEIEIIDKAARITLNAIGAVEARLPGFVHESQIEAALTYEFRNAGAEGHAFSPIVASGPASCTLHYIANNQPLKNGALLLDVGAELTNYSADISRTLLLPVHTKQEQLVINEVTRAQQAIIMRLKPGITWSELAQIADEEVAKSLVSIGVLPKRHGSDDIRHYFPHAVSHFLGLDTHDVGDYTKPLREGMVITIEPGIYLPQFAFGVRVEDDVLITSTGHRVLGMG